MRRTWAHAAAVLALATAAHADVAVEHKQVGCIVVGKYPKLGACFTPASQLARGRVYFRPEGTPSWYYVEMTSDQPCHAGILPRPGKKLVGQKIEYYVEGQDRSFNAARTTEFTPVVVESQAECDKDVPVAPFLTNANVAVFPALPAGFVGGIGAATTAAVVAGGAAVVGTTAAVVAASNDDTTTTTVAIGGNTTTTVAATTTTTVPATTTTTVPSGSNRPPFAVLTANPTSGVSPLTVTFNLCGSTDPDGDPLSYFFNFGDGVETQGACEVTHTYVATSFQAFDVRAARAMFEAEACVVDPRGASHCRGRTIDVQPPPQPTTTTTTTMCPAPTITITSPDDPSYFSDPPIPVTAEATTTGAVRFAMDEVDCSSGLTVENADVVAVQVGPTAPGGSTFSTSLDPPDDHDCYRIRATAMSSCSSATADATPVRVAIGDTFCGFCGFGLASRAASGIGWTSDLAVGGGRLQLVVNGAASSFPDRGRTYGVAALVEGQNRVEATLVEGRGQSGLWRFEMTYAKAVLPGTIQVLSGDVVEIRPTGVTFRLNGNPGQRVVFTFFRK